MARKSRSTDAVIAEEPKAVPRLPPPGTVIQRTDRREAHPSCALGRGDKDAIKWISPRGWFVGDNCDDHEHTSRHHWLLGKYEILSTPTWRSRER